MFQEKFFQVLAVLRRTFVGGGLYQFPHHRLGGGNRAVHYSLRCLFSLFVGVEEVKERFQIGSAWRDFCNALNKPFLFLLRLGPIRTHLVTPFLDSRRGVSRLCLNPSQHTRVILCFRNCLEKVIGGGFQERQQLLIEWAIPVIFSQRPRQFCLSFINHPWQMHIAAQRLLGTAGKDFPEID